MKPLSKFFYRKYICLKIGQFTKITPVNTVLEKKLNKISIKFFTAESKITYYRGTCVFQFIQLNNQLKILESIQLQHFSSHKFLENQPLSQSHPRKYSAREKLNKISL